MRSPISVALVPPSLHVLWKGQTAAMVYATISYKTTLHTADANLLCLNSVVKVWLWLWLPEIIIVGRSNPAVLRSVGELFTIVEICN